MWTGEGWKKGKRERARNKNDPELDGNRKTSRLDAAQESIEVNS